ncbi:hypothetical protein AB1Y20_018142 [Prymnesium parvum]|uniref:DNA mismatch repair proteins mutS family domain-containing protein n=1 Tax=Prymnesium parvum TaxID=97485 RepID=A0AB34JNH1_PRYPA
MAMAQSKLSKYFASRAQSKASSYFAVRSSTAHDPAAAPPSKRPRPPPAAPAAAPRGLSVAAVAARVGAAELTPLEQQVVHLKSSTPGALLLVEVGYKYLAFGEDALELAAALDVEAFERNHLMVAGFPTHRLCVHIRRLLHRGARVAVARQRETAAARAHADEAGRPFVREVAAVFTLATFVAEAVEAAGCAAAHEEAAHDAARPPLLLCAFEAPAAGGVALSLLGVDVRSGGVSVETFVEPHGRRAHLRARLEALLPVELLLPPRPSLSAETARELRQYEHTARAAGLSAPLRLSHAPSHRFSIDEALRSLHPPPPASPASPAAHRRLLALLALPDGAARCVGALCAPLAACGQLGLLADASAFRTPPPRHVALGDAALRDLHVRAPATHSLLSLVGPALTAFGERTLRAWVCRPLADGEAIGERLAAVGELRALGLPRGGSGRRGGIGGVADVLRGCPDLERVLARVSTGQGRAAPLRACLVRLCGVAEAASRCMAAEGAAAEGGVRWEDEAPSSALLRRLLFVEEDAVVCVRRWARLLEPASADGAQLSDLFDADSAAMLEGGVDTAPVAAARAALSAFTASIERDQLPLARQAAGLPHARFSHSAATREEYFLAVPHGHAVPPDWVRVGQTKAHVRYRPPQLAAALVELALLRERLAAAVGEAWAALQRRVAERMPQLRAWVDRLAQLDALLALARLAATDGYCAPRLLPPTAAARLCIEEGRHPLLEAFAPHGRVVVPNDLCLGEEGAAGEEEGGEGGAGGARPRCLIVTGPNAGGKSAGLIAWMAQIGSFVPARRCELTPMLQIHTRMGAADSICNGLSTLASELTSASEALAVACPRSLVLFDELGRGTASHDGAAIAHATLAHIATVTRSLCLFTTHYPEVAGLATALPKHIAVCHMAVMQPSRNSGSTSRPNTPTVSGSHPSADQREPPVELLYRVAEGFGSGSFGIQTGASAGLPPKLLQSAEEHSKKLEQRARSRQQESMLLVLGAKVMMHLKESGANLGGAQVGTTKETTRILQLEVASALQHVF